MDDLLNKPTNVHFSLTGCLRQALWARCTPTKYTACNRNQLRQEPGVTDSCVFTRVEARVVVRWNNIGLDVQFMPHMLRFKRAVCLAVVLILCSHKDEQYGYGDTTCTHNTRQTHPLLREGNTTGRKKEGLPADVARATTR